MVIRRADRPAARCISRLLAKVSARRSDDHPDARSRLTTPAAWSLVPAGRRHHRAAEFPEFLAYNGGWWTSVAQCRAVRGRRTAAGDVTGSWEGGGRRSSSTRTFDDRMTLEIGGRHVRAAALRRVKRRTTLTRGSRNTLRPRSSATTSARFVPRTSTRFAAPARDGRSTTSSRWTRCWRSSRSCCRQATGSRLVPR